MNSTARKGDAWNVAVAKYRAAEAALSNHPYAKAAPGGADTAALEADQSSYVTAATDAAKALFATPVPNAAALDQKLAIYAAEFGADEELASVFEDVRQFSRSTSCGSALLAMHRRYECAMAEYLIVEQAEGAARKDGDSDGAHSLARGTRAICRETDALRLAILNQVPDTWAAAMVLQFHITNAADLLATSENPPEAEREALLTAIDTLFDFLCCEVDQDHEALGNEFRSGAVRAFFQRRHRTGQVED